MVSEEEPSENNLSDSLLFKSLLSEGKTEKALALSESILEESRKLGDRDFEAEAWIRMERALLGAIEPENVGNELRWCVDRLASVSPGSPLHGLALLNLASWHRNSNERMMALVTLADITSEAGHPVDVIGLSRLESGRILASIGDLEPAMRHLWMAMRRLSSSEMATEAVVCAMEWLDIALDEIDRDSPSMDERIVNAKPREAPGMTTTPANPADIREAVELILQSALKDVSGEKRDDLGLVLDASETLEEPQWREAIEELRSDIQDPRLIEVLQS
ncbi:MAG: hypothetical protein VX626_05220 [Candidatus Thermoplasmatota archaeon]|jgi:hypothetical protein|nr:hypothetical protein [Candidatus Thermoplasmatota archaeon]|tara:strand:- start:37 stop:867 length:831 start_codon:yes stop_codon:yes gene_type:complete